MAITEYVRNPSPPHTPSFTSFHLSFPFSILNSETLHYTNHMYSFTPFFHCPLLSFLSFTLSCSLFAGETLLWAKFRTGVIQYSSLTSHSSLSNHQCTFRCLIIFLRLSYVSLSFTLSKCPYSCLLAPLDLMDRKYKRIETIKKTVILPSYNSMS